MSDNSDKFQQIKLLYKSATGEDKRLLAYDFKKDVILRDIRNERHFKWIARNGKVIAFAHLSDRPNKAIVIEELYIIPKYRSHGIGTKLLDKLIDSAKGDIIVKTKSDNDRMIHILSERDFDIIKQNSETITWILVK